MCCVEASDRRPGASREAAGSASDPLGSRRLDTSVPVRSLEFRVPNSAGGRTANGFDFAYICIPYHTTSIGVHTIFRSLDASTRPTSGVSAAARARLPAGARLTRRPRGRRRAAIIDYRMPWSLGRSPRAPARGGRGPPAAPGTSRARRGVACSCGGGFAGGATGVRGRNDHRPLTSAQPVPEARSRHRPSAIAGSGL